MSKIRGGSVIRRPSTTGDVGTAGCLVQFPNIPEKLYMLTAGHCLVGPLTKQFDPVEEVISENRPGQQLGRLAGWTTSLGELTADAALIEVDPALVDPEIGDLGPPGSVNGDPKVGDELIIFGLGQRRTGKIQELPVDMSIDMRIPDFEQPLRVNYLQQIKCTSFSEAGCSGAIALDKDRNVVGMVVAGDGSKFTLVTPIDAVLAHPKWGTDLPALQICRTIPVTATAPEPHIVAGISSVITADRLRALCPAIRADILEAILTDAPQVFPGARLNSTVRIAHFFAQIATETEGLRRLDENLNYTTAARLRQVFPALFPTDESARPFLGDPEKLGNFVYANKLGNNQPGDGFAYRGSGLIQLTGRANFRDVGISIGNPLLENTPELARHSDSALQIALGYWSTRDINKVADGSTDADVVEVTRLVHPALAALTDRQAYFRKALSIFARPVPSARPVAFSDPAPVRLGTNSADGNQQRSELSGPQWVERFPTSRSITDLAPSFAANVREFMDALEAAGAKFEISATLRPKQRTYLMHWAWEIGINLFDPSTVPPMDGVPVRWAHPELAHSRLAAQQMVTAYGMVQIAALNSQHTDGLAIDMTIFWTGSLSIRQRNGSAMLIESQPRNGSNPELISVGAGYGVIKLPSDPPHWSNDGR
jgi:predicted chitinase